MKTQTALEKILNWIEKFSTGLEILNWIGNSQLDWKFLGLEILNWIEKFFNGIGNSQLD